MFINYSGGQVEIPTDEEWETLWSPDRLNKAQELAYTKRKTFEQKSEELEKDYILELRRLTKTNLFFLSHTVLGYNQLSTRLHGYLCAWEDRSRTYYRYDKERQIKEFLAWQFRLRLLPRAHFKTTIDTISESIQTVLPPDGLDLPYPYNLGPACRLLLGHEILGGAQRFLYEITGHFTGNPTLLALYPELLPNPRTQRMNKSELDLPKSDYTNISWSEPTFDTMGAGGRNQGKHWDKLKLDDIFGEAARDSKTERESLIQWFDNIQSFLVDLDRSVIDVSGTRYIVEDIYGHIIKVYGNKLKKYIRRIEEYDESEGKASPIFPEKFPTRALNILRKNKLVWAAQYCNDPRGGLAEWKTEWIQYYHKGTRPLVSFYPFSPDGIQRGLVTRNLSDLDVMILVDPMISRLPGIIVTGMDVHRNVFILDYSKEIMNPTEFLNKLYELNMKWLPRALALEYVAFSEVYGHWIEDRNRNLRINKINVIPYKPPKEKLKDDRISILAVQYSSRKIYYPTEEIGQENNEDSLIWEMSNFGATENIHLHDALSQGPQEDMDGNPIWRVPVDKMRSRNRIERERKRVGIDRTTGYSEIEYED